MPSSANLIRLTGMNSGMDTESIITALVSSKQTKVDDAKKAQTKLQWTQDAWKDLNSQIYGLYSGKLSNMRFSTAYSKMATKTSNSALTVVAGNNAVQGVQTAKIVSAAKAGYLTGGELETTEGGKVKADTKLSDMGINPGSISVTVGGNTKDIEITDDMTMSGLVSKLKDAGVNANFDEVNQRLFISSKSTGLKNDFSFGGDVATLKNLGLTEDAGAKKLAASDAELELNGATFKSDTNSLTINGSTYIINSETSDKISITTETDTSGIYDMIKDFLKEYNTAINAMSKAYNAEAAKGYEPLTDDMKAAMSEKQIDDWESKIKDSLLRKDSTLSGLMSAMRMSMSEGIEIDGVTMYLSDFGINTPGYFDADANERYAYHIDGDADDSTVSSKTDKLKAAIASDPTKVTKFFQELSNKLYTSLYDKMGSTEYSSIYKVYNDKKMKSDYDSYTKKIADLEKKLQEAEDKYYKQFSKMETALSKLNSNQSYLSGLFAR